LICNRHAETDGSRTKRRQKLSLRETLKKARAKRGWSLREAERQTGVHNAHLSQIEGGSIARPDANVLYALARSYGLDYPDLLRQAGHVQVGANAAARSPYGAVAWKVLSELDDEQQREVLDYMAKLRRTTNGNSGDQ